MRTRARVLVLSSALLAAASSAFAGDLASFLERADRMAGVNEKVTAQVTMQRGDDAPRKLVLTLDPAGGGSQILEDPATGFRSETPLAWAPGKAVTKTGASPTKVGPDDPLADTDLRGIDFFPFWKTDYTRCYISDENPAEQTVSLYAREDQPYKLYVVTFDKAKMVPLTAKYYRDSFRDMVRVRTNRNYVMVGSRPRPTEVSVQDFKNNTTTTYTLEWKAGADASH